MLWKKSVRLGIPSGPCPVPVILSSCACSLLINSVSEGVLASSVGTFGIWSPPNITSACAGLLKLAPISPNFVPIPDNELSNPFKSSGPTNLFMLR